MENLEEEMNSNRVYIMRLYCGPRSYNHSWKVAKILAGKNYNVYIINAPIEVIQNIICKFREIELHKTVLIITGNDFKTVPDAILGCCYHPQVGD